MNRRFPIIAAAAAGLLIAAAPTAIAEAAPSQACAQWEFNGDTAVKLGPNGSAGSIDFSAVGSSIPDPVAATQSLVYSGPDGPQVSPPQPGAVSGSIGPTGQIEVDFTPGSGAAEGDPPTWSGNGQVNPDGTVQGNDWSISSPLTCMSTTRSETHSA